MKMEIAHVGRTGKETTITFDTDKKIYCYGREPHDVYIYVEQTRDVKNVINDLTKIGYKEVERIYFRQEKDNDVGSVSLQSKTRKEGAIFQVQNGK